jgi:hypothetical protein
MSSTARDYGLAPALRARLMGTFLAGVGVVLLAVTVLVALLHLSLDVISVVVLLVIAGIVALGFALSRRWYVVRVDDLGFRVRFVRGVGEPQGRWADVEDLATSVLAGSPCVVIRMRSGRSTTIPVDLIVGDREEFVRELQRRLDAAHGFKR